MPRKQPELLEYNETGKPDGWRTWAQVDLGTASANRRRTVEMLLDLREEGFKKAAVRLNGKRVQPSKAEIQEVLEWRSGPTNANVVGHGTGEVSRKESCV